MTPDGPKFGEMLTLGELCAANRVENRRLESLRPRRTVIEEPVPEEVDDPTPAPQQLEVPFEAPRHGIWQAELVETDDSNKPT